MWQVKSLLSTGVLLGVGLLSACSRPQVEPDNPVVEPSVGAPGDVVVVDPVVIDPVVIEPVPVPDTGSPVVLEPAPSAEGIHIVQPREGLYGIARQYGLDFRQLAAWNNIPPPYVLQPGQRLVLSGTHARAPVASPPVAPSPVTPAPVANDVHYHVVRPGETLYRIAKNYNLNYRDVAQQNGIPYPYNLSVGQRISLYTAVAPRAGSPAYHTVQTGETLYSLSRRYGFSVLQLANWNGLYPPYTLRLGQSVRVSP